MPRSADYFGLIAYMFVMYGGLPGSDSLWLNSSQPSRRKSRRPELKVVASSDEPKPQRRTVLAATEAAA